MRNKENTEGLNSLEVVGTMCYFEFLIEPQVVSAALAFMGTEFTLRKLQESKSYVTLSSILWFVNSSKVNFDCEGMKIKVIKSCSEPDKAFAVNIGRVFVEEFPSQELLSSYNTDASIDLATKTYDEDAALPTSEDKGNEGSYESQLSESSETQTVKAASPSFNLITLNVLTILY